MTLTLNFQGQIWNSLHLGQKWSNCHETKSKHIYWTLSLKCDHRIWPWPWPWLNFQGQIWNLLYLSQRWFVYHKMKSKYIEWTEDLNDNQVWPWPWPWKVTCKDLPDSDRVASDVSMLSTRLVQDGNEVCWTIATHSNLVRSSRRLVAAAWPISELMIQYMVINKCMQLCSSGGITQWLQLLLNYEWTLVQLVTHFGLFVI